MEVGFFETIARDLSGKGHSADPSAPGGAHSGGLRGVYQSDLEAHSDGAAPADRVTPGGQVMEETEIAKGRGRAAPAARPDDRLSGRLGIVVDGKTVARAAHGRRRRDAGAGRRRDARERARHQHGRAAGASRAAS